MRASYITPKELEANRIKHSSVFTELCHHHCILFSFYLLPVSGLTCFSCTVKPPSKARSAANNNTFVRLCSRFDASPSYEVDCPLSTLCQTRTFQLHTRSGEELESCIKNEYDVVKLIEYQSEF